MITTLANLKSEKPVSSLCVQMKLVALHLGDDGMRDDGPTGSGMGSGGSGGENDDDDDGEETDAKKQARLIRNRESAQLSRQRKKQYLDELERRCRGGGLCKLHAVDPQRLKPPGDPTLERYKVKNWFLKVCFFKFGQLVSLTPRVADHQLGAAQPGGAAHRGERRAARAPRHGHAAAAAAWPAADAAAAPGRAPAPKPPSIPPRLPARPPARDDVPAQGGGAVQVESS